MRRMRQIRLEKGFTITELSKQSGVPMACISRHELGTTTTSSNYLGRIAEVLGVTAKELSKDEISRTTMKCLNQVCPLNKDKKCVNDIVISGRNSCYGRNKVEAKVTHGVYGHVR